MTDHYKHTGKAVRANASDVRAIFDPNAVKEAIDDSDIKLKHNLFNSKAEKSVDVANKENVEPNYV